MKDYSGYKKGKLTAISFSKRENNKTFWLTKCDCGVLKEMRIDKVVIGRIKSCGCIGVGTKPSLESVKKLLFRQYKKGAKHRGYSFNLNYDFFIQIVLNNCFYCGSEPLNKQQSFTKNSNIYFLRNGIDRINNNIGYEVDNCVPCCFICNRAKSNLDYNDFINWINKIKNNN